MALDDIIKRHKQYLTNAQIKSLAEMSEKYKQVNAQRRAEAYGNLYTNHQAFRRGLQNMGLASRRGNLISGREVMGRVNVEDTYHRFNDQLRVGEDRMTENQAIRYANQTINARNEAAQRAREEYEKQLAEAQAFQKKQIDAHQVDLQSTDDPNQYDPFKHTTAENLEIFRMQAKQSGMKRSEINAYAAQQAAAVEKERANRKSLAESALAQKSVIDKETIAKDVLSFAKERMVTDSFLQNYGLTRENYATLKATNPEAAQQIDTRVQQLYAELEKNSAQWRKDIAAGNEKVGLGSGDTAENKEAQNRADNARLAIAKVNTELARLSGAVQNPEYANLYLMTDDEFSVAYDAAEKLYQKRMHEANAKEHSSDKISTTGYTPQMQYRGNMGSDVAAQAKQSAAQKEAEAMRGEALRDFSGFIQAKHDRSQVVEIEALAQQFAVPDKTVKDEYGTVDVRKSQKNWQGVAWAKPYEWDGTNWKNAHDHNYDPSKYEETHDTKGSKYDALVNEWAFINGRTALLYTQKFQTVSDVADIGEFIGYVFGGEVNRNEAYNLFRNDCVMAFNHDWEDSGTKAQKEQMDAYLTLANLMTDEERERFNALKEQMGGKYADEYFEHLYNDVLPARLASYLEEELGFQTRDPLRRIESSLMSVPVNLAQGISGPIHSWTTGQEDPVAAQLGAMKYNTAQNMRNAVMENYSERGRFWYGTAMSMADSAVVAAISSGIGNVAGAALKGVGMGAEMAAKVGGKIGSVLGGSILGGSAYNSAYDEALKRGLSPERARQTAFGTGVNEMLFESLSLDLLVSRFKVGDMLKVSKNGFVNYVVNTLVEAGVEGSEEVFTDMANRMWDNGINDVFSEELTKVRKYMADGMSYEDAKRKVNEEFGAQLWEAFKGGFISGGVMGGAAGAMYNYNMRNAERTGKSLDSKTRKTIDNFEFKDERLQEIQKQSKKTNQDYGVLYEGMRAELFDRYKGNVEQAVNDGTITKQDADLLDKYQKDGVQVVDKDGKIVANENGITSEQENTVEDTLSKLDITPLMEIVQNDQQLRLNQEIGVKNVEAITAHDENVDAAEKAYNKTVESVKNDTTLTAEQKAEKISEAQRKKEAAITKASDELGAAVGKKRDIRIESDGKTVKTKKGSGKVTFDFSTRVDGKNENHNTVNKMTAREKGSLIVAQMMAEETGSNIMVESQFTGENADKNGYYDKDTDTIHVNLNGTNSVVWTVSHELTHRLATMNKEGYTELRDAIKVALSKEDVSVDDLNLSYNINKVLPYLTEGGTLWDALVAYEQKRGYSKEVAEEEVVARCCERFLAMSTFVNTFAKNHYKTARNVSKFLTRISAGMQSLYSDVQERSTKAATTRNEKGMYETWNTDVSPEQDLLAQFAAVEDIARKWENAVRSVEQQRKAKEGAKAESVKASTMEQKKFSTQDIETTASIQDSKGNNLSIKQIDYFDKSKVRDKEGRLRPVYHYTNEAFTEFRPMEASKGSRRTHGDGYYVSTNATEFAEFGKNKMVMYANITNPFEMEMTEEEANKVYDKYAAKFHTTDKYGSYREHAIGALQSSYKVMDYLREYAEQNGIQISEIIKDLGYDGVHDGSEWVAYDSNQIKNVDNLNPTKNDDIRYSTQDKDFHLTQRIGEQRVYEMRGTTANVYGSSVDLSGGTLLTRVRMMQNLAEMYGSVTVTATSEKEAQAFEKAGAKREVDTFGDSEYGTWAFEHQENKYEQDTKYDAKQKRNFAKEVLKEIGTFRNFSKEDMRIIRAKLEKAFAVLHNAWHGQGDQLVAMEYADKLFDQMLNRYSEMSEADAQMRDELLAEIPTKTDGRGRTYHEIEVTAAQMAEIKNSFTVAEFNAALSKALGTRVVVKEAQNAKTLEDVFANNSYLDATTNEGDMPMVLLERAQETVGKRENPYKAESDERALMKDKMFAKALDIVGVEKSSAQKVREAVKQARAEERAKAKTKLQAEVEKARLAERMHEGAIRAKERRGYAERETNIKREAARREEKLKDITKQKLEQQKLNTLRRDVKTIALKWNQKLVKMLANPTEASHIPIQLAKEVAEFTDTLTRFLDSGTQRGQLNLDKIARAYQQAFDDQATIEQAKAENPKYDPRGTVLDKEMFDEQLVQMMNELNEVLKGKSLKDLSAFEMRMLLNTVRGVAHTVYEANRMIGTDERKAIWQVGDKMVSELENAPKISDKLRGYLETSLDLRRIAKIFSGSNENAEFVKLVKQLNDGAIEKERIAQTLQNIFKPVTDQYGNEIRKWYGKNAEWIDTGIQKNGHKVEITKGMRVSLALHVLNEGNMRHIENGGLTIPNRELYRKGNLADAYANGELVRLNAEQIDEIISHMTEAEKAYVEAAKELFHKRTGYYINKTSLALLGYRKAMVENYFPIHTDKNFTKTDFASLKMDGSIEGQGFLKERVNATNPVYLEDITSVVNRQIRGVALYAGLAIPMRNFNAVMNASIYEDDNGVWSPRTTVKQTLTQEMGAYGAKTVEGFLSDVSEMSHVDVTPMERFAGKLATNYVKAVLLGNLKVAMKQVASYPTAAAVIPWKYLGKALLKGGRNSRLISRADVDLINQYTPLYQMRREGQANEIASIMQKRGMEQKLPWLLGWITKMDVMTVGRLWSAAEYMVADQQKNLPVGSDAYYQAVAQVFNDTVQQTQPNFTPLQRNAALRSKNPIVRSLVLFGTQRMQNGDIIMEAAYELKQSKGKSKAEIQAAKRKLGRAVASQIVQNILLIVASLGVDALRGRMKSWQDDDDEITAESLAKGMGDMFLSNAVGSFLGGSEVYNLISAWYKKATGGTAYDSEFTVPALDAAETIINFMQDLPDVIKYLSSDHTVDEKLKKAKTFSMNLAKAAGYATGIPMENALKDLFKGIIPAIKDHADYFKTGELIPYLHQSGKLDAKKTSERYKEWTAEGRSGREFFYWDNKMKGLTKRDDRIAMLENENIPNEDKAKLVAMFDTSGAYAEGTKVYRSNGKEYYDFANAKSVSKVQSTLDDIEEASEIPAMEPAAEPVAEENMLSEAKQEGVKQAVAQGVPEQTANDAFMVYQNMGKNHDDGYSRNDDFRAWLFSNVDDPHQRAVLEYQVIGQASKVEGGITYRESGTVYRDYTNESWFKLSEHNLAKDGTNKRYDAAKKLEKTGLTVDKTVALYDGLKDLTKKAQWVEYLKKQGLTDEQVNIFLWSRGWAK